MASSVRWVSNQRARWGVVFAGVARDSRVEQTSPVPDWVIDAVLVHELAHLQEADHSPAFYEIANRHPRQDECGQFLDGYALGLGLRIEGGDVDTEAN